MKAGWIYKVILIGSSGIGKSSFIKNHNNIENKKYLEDYSESIGTNFYIEKIPVSKEKFCQLQFWDLNITENFFFVLPSFFRGSSAFLLFFDTSDYSSFLDLEVWIEIIHSYSENAPIFLIGTKTDLIPEVSLNDILDFAQAEQLYGPFFTSIKKKSQTDIIFNYIVETLTGIPISSKGNGILMEMQEQYDLNFNNTINNKDHKIHEENSQNNILLLREIMQHHFSSSKVMERDISPEEHEELERFLEYFKYCPVCHQENHKKYLEKFFFSNDPFKLKIKESVLKLMEHSEGRWDDRIYYNKLTVGIPCCNCFNKIFQK